MATLFPIFLKLERRNVLVVGAGAIAEQKLDCLLSACASIHVVAPRANEVIAELAHQQRLRWTQREFQPTDLEGVVLVVAATGDPQTNQQIFRAAQARRILCNAVDEPERCDFYYPAVVQRGDLQIAISTAGHSPALAQRIRRELEAQFAEDYAEWLQWLGQTRRRLNGKPLDPQHRRRMLHRLAKADVYERFSRSWQARRAGESQ
jgi:precorrin-2 dehydrogenase/sirohydrochlorin ferrochelatase